MVVAEILKERRQTLGLSQVDLAEMAGVGIATVKNIECGKANPSIRTIESIAEVLGLELSLTLKNCY
ncbi:MAG: helix-turn-helix transcriptional regulator [Bacteroidales bacterium]|nr:helix-turn-helix transcriptional regulator [Bacteroidales bacterium]